MFKVLYNLILPRWSSMLLAIIVGTIASLSTVGLMGLAGWLIASAALEPPLYTLSLAITGVRFCGVFRAVFRYLERLLSHKVGFAFFNDFRKQIIREMVELVPFKVAADQGNIYDAIVNAVDKMRDAFLRFSLPPLTSLLCGLILAAFMGMYHWLLGLWFIILTLVFLCMMPYVVNCAYGKLPVAKQDLTQDIMEMYSGQVEMTIYGYTENKLAGAKKLVEAYQESFTIHNNLQTRITLLMEFITALSLVMTICLVIYLNQIQVLNGVWCITVILATQALLEFYQGVPALWEWVWESKNAYKTLVKYTSKPQELLSAIKVDNYENKGYLASENLGFGYGELMLKDLNLDINKGDKILLLGPSGVGKSTLFYVLTKLLNYQQGSLGFGQKDYTKWQGEDLRRRFAPALQEHHLFAGTVRENFRFLHPDIKDEEILASLQKVGNRLFIKVEDLDYELVEDGGNLSGGQRHTLILAMVLAKADDVILLDEPTSGLDIQTSNKLLNSIMMDYKHCTVLVTSHDLSVLNCFNKVIILGEAGIVEQGSIKELLAMANSKLNLLKAYENVL